MVAVFLHLPSHIACTSEEPTFSYVIGCSKHVSQDLLIFHFLAEVLCSYPLSRSGKLLRFSAVERPWWDVSPFG